MAQQWLKALVKKTDLVLVGADPGSKYDKAKDLGIKVLNDEETTKLITELKGEI